MTDIKQLYVDVRPAVQALVASHGVWAVLREALAAKLNANRAPPGSKRWLPDVNSLSAHMRRDMGLPAEKRPERHGQTFL